MKIRLLSHPFVLAFVFLLSCLFSSISFSKEIDRVQLIHELLGYPEDLIKFNNEAFFIALSSDDFFDYDLMRSDGTRNGTIVIKSFTGYAPDGFLKKGENKLGSHAKSSAPLVINGFFYFIDQVYNPTISRRIWRSDGTKRGTVLVKTIQEGFVAYAVLNNSLYFLNYDALWKTNGTPQGTKKIASFMSAPSRESPLRMLVYKDKLFFPAYDSRHSNELWVSDGTSAGTKLFMDINPIRREFTCNGHDTCQESNSDPRYFVAYKSQLYFSANDGVHGHELWKTDGSISGTKLVRDIRSGPAYSMSYDDGIVLGDKLLFLANDGIHGEELWKTDGTTAGTVLLKDIIPGVNSCCFSLLGSVGLAKNVNSHLYFSIHLNNGKHQLWKTNGTRAGTRQVKNNLAGDGYYGVVFDSMFYFAGHGNHSVKGDNRELWRTNGSSNGTTLVKDIFPSFDMYDKYNSSWPSDFAAFDDFVVFTAKRGWNYRSNGSRTGKYGLFRLDRGFNIAPILDLLLLDDD